MKHKLWFLLHIHVQLCFHGLFLKAQTYSNERDMWNTFGETICNVCLVFHGQLPSSRTLYFSVVNGVTVVKTNWIQLWAVCTCKDLQLHWYVCWSLAKVWSSSSCWRRSFICFGPRSTRLLADWILPRLSLTKWGTQWFHPLAWLLEIKSQCLAVAEQHH